MRRAFNTLAACCRAAPQFNAVLQDPCAACNPPAALPSPLCRSVLHALCALLQVLQLGDCGGGQGPAARHAAQRAAAGAQSHHPTGLPRCWHAPFSSQLFQRIPESAACAASVRSPVSRLPALQFSAWPLASFPRVSTVRGHGARDGERVLRHPHGAGLLLLHRFAVSKCHFFPLAATGPRHAHRPASSSRLAALLPSFPSAPLTCSVCHPRCHVCRPSSACARATTTSLTRFAAPSTAP